MAPSTSSRCATTNKLHADLSDCTNTVRETFAPLPAALRTLSTRVMYLRGGGGRAFVLAAEAAENKTRIADAARIMKECVTLIDAGIAKGARVEAAERKVSSAVIFHVVADLDCSSDCSWDHEKSGQPLPRDQRSLVSRPSTSDLAPS